MYFSGSSRVTSSQFPGPVSYLLPCTAFPCQHCSKVFSSNANLKKHTMTHTGEKPYLCEFCNKRFRLKHHLRDHVNCRHTHTVVL